ncbi:MAG: hypothetical protein ACRDU5_18310 [Mycobacterium sp.]
MRATTTTRLAVAGTLLVLSGFTAGCQSGIEGTPVTTSKSPTEPSFPTSRPTAKPPITIVPSKKPPTAVPPADAEPLPPDESGYVFIETKSGQTRCQIDEQTVGCEAPFTNTPLQNGVRANGVNLSADGAVEWIVGNLGDIPVVTIDYRTYTAVGWTIVATSDGTRFTNQRTGHGMFVSIDNVDTY